MASVPAGKEVVLTDVTVKTSFWWRDRVSCVDDVTNTIFCPASQLTGRFNRRDLAPMGTVAANRDQVW